MGLSSSKSKSKSTSTQQSTTTPTVPDWITEPLQGYTGKVSEFLNSDPAQFVAGASPLQQQAFSAAGTLGGVNERYGTAAEMAKTAGAAPAAGYEAPRLGDPAKASLGSYNAPTLGTVDLAPAHTSQAESLLQNLDRYLDPATQQLVDAALRNYDFQTGKSAAALQASQARSGAFGGSRAGIAQGEFAAGSDRGRALTEAELRAQAFGQAAQMSEADATRRQQAGMFNAGALNNRDLVQGQYDLQRLLAQAGMDDAAARHRADAMNQQALFNSGATQQYDLAQAGLDAEASRFNASAQEGAMNRALEAAGLLGNLGTAEGADARANLGLAADLGEMERAIEAARAGAPLSQLQAAGQLYGFIPYGSYTGQQMSGTGSSTSVQKTSPSLFDQALAAASAAAAFSDRRLKKDVERVGSAGLIPLYSFRYAWDEDGTPKRVGVMADEVERLRPEALGPTIAGFSTVDYGKLDLAGLAESLRRPESGPA